jgi:hypothetical protein
MGALRADVHWPVHAVVLRARMIRVLMVSSTHCRNEAGCGSHQIRAILSPAAADRSPLPGEAKIDHRKDLTDSRKGAILVP